MATVKVKGEKGGYSVLDEKCIGCECLRLGSYQSRGATLSGSRNTGSYDQCCMTRAYHGCPSEADRGYSQELAKQRKSEGYKVSLL